MRIERRDGSDERKILIGMIIDPLVLTRISRVWDKRLFASKWSNILGDWCIDFHQRYDKPPANAIEGLFEVWADGKDEKLTRPMDKFLSSLSGEYDRLGREINSEYVLDLAGKHFNRIRLRRVADDIHANLDIGDDEKANQRIDSHIRLEIGPGATIEVLTDQDAIREAFEQKSKPLIEYPGDLGKFFGNHLERDGFIAFMGPEKRGKTWWLLDIAWRAMLQRRRVAFFEVGDLSQSQIMRRFMIRASKHPMNAKSFQYPTDINHTPGEQFASAVVEERSVEEPLDWRTAVRAAERVMRRTKSKKSFLRLSCHPNSTLSITGMRAILATWEREDWSPDVIVIDYADILAPPVGETDIREKINTNWKQMRAMSQSLHCLVVTASQTDARSYDATTIGRSHFSEDKRKLAHVTGMLGINTTPEEKIDGVQRLNWVVLREGEYSEGQCVHVAGCLAIANPAIRSTF